MERVTVVKLQYCSMVLGSFRYHAENEILTHELDRWGGGLLEYIIF